MVRPRHFSRVLSAAAIVKPRGKEAQIHNGGRTLKLGGVEVDAERLARRSVSRLLETRPGTPKLVRDLGGLCELVLDLASVRNRVVRLLAGKDALKQDQLGDRVWSFNPRAVKLVGDGNGDLHIAGFYRLLPDALQRGRTYPLGAVVRLVGRNDLGKGEAVDVPHPFAPHGGEYPELHYRDGFLFFRGGTYSITARGIEG